MAEIEAMILAGGLGTRLQSVVSDRQKVAAQVAGRPFLHHLLNQLQQHGFRKVTLCLGYQAGSVEKSLAGRPFNLELQFSREETLLGTGGAVRLALAKIRTEQILILNGDSFLDADLTGFQHWKQENKIQAAMLLAKVENVERYGQVETTPAGKILAFAEKGACRGPGLINAGIYLLDRELLQTIPEQQKFSLEKDLFPALVRRGLLHGQVSSGAFIDIGTPESYRQAQTFFSGKNIP